MQLWVASADVDCLGELILDHFTYTYPHCLTASWPLCSQFFYRQYSWIRYRHQDCGSFPNFVQYRQRSACDVPERTLWPFSL